MLEIKDYLLEYKRKIPNILLIWTIILTFIIICLIIINNTVTIKSYYQVQGIVKNKSLSIYVLVEDLNKVVDNKKIYINEYEYNYKVSQISRELITNNTNFYKEIIIDVNLNDKIFIDNNIIVVKFVIKEKTIFEYIINLVRGEHDE